MLHESGYETFLPLRAPRSRLGVATSVRSALVTSSIQSLRARGLHERYATRLGEGRRAAIATAARAVWIPMDLAVAHYEACEALHLGVGQQLDISLEVGQHLHGRLLRAMLRLARTAGVTPWAALAYSGRLYGRLFRGGGIEVTRTGPKDARIDMTGNPLCDIEYFRVGVRGVYESALELFCQRVFTQEIHWGRLGYAMALRISWV
jgi:hypothetical protein